LFSVAFPFRIKVCGITSEEAARAAVDEGADHLGLVLCASPRRVTVERAAALVAGVSASWVGVFVDSSLDELIVTTRKLGLSAVQLHGSETVGCCEAVRAATGLPVWKAIRAEVAGTEAGYEGAVDALLLDAVRGGSGQTLDWRSIGTRFPRPRRIPMVLAGGLGPDNVAAAIVAARPDGVDASSRLELAPGVKDPDLVRAFVRRARAAAESVAADGVARVGQ
jgi:phosphoribosylanthranilate isomerase